MKNIFKNLSLYQLLILLLLSTGLVAGQLIRIPFITQNITILDLALIISILAALLKTGFHFPPIPSWIKTGTALTLVMIISLIFTPFNLVLEERLVGLSYLLRFVLYIFSGWIISQSLSPKFNQISQILIIFSGTVLAFLGLFQLIFLPDLSFLTAQGWDPHYFRTVSTFLDPNFLGTFLVLCSLYLFTNIKNVVKQKLLTFSFLLNYFAIITTFSRSTALMFFLGFTLFSLLKKSPKIFLLTLFLSLGILFSFIIYQPLISEPQKIDRQKSAQLRFTTWQMGLEIFQKNPLLGVGFNNYRYALKEYKLATSQFIESHGGSTNDSSLLFITATTGVIGFISYLFFIFSIIFTAWKKYITDQSKISAVAIAGILALLINSFFINSLFYPWILFWISFTAAQISKD